MAVRAAHLALDSVLASLATAMIGVINTAGAANRSGASRSPTPVVRHAGNEAWQSP